MEYAAPGSRTAKSGWLNRYLAATSGNTTSGLRGLGMQKLLPRSLRGEYPVLAVPDGRGRDLGGVLDVFEDLYGGEAKDGGAMDGDRRPEDTASGAAVRVGRDTIRTLRELDEILASAPATGGGSPLPPGSLRPAARRSGQRHQGRRGSRGGESGPARLRHPHPSGRSDGHHGQSTPSARRRSRRVHARSRTSFRRRPGPRDDRVRSNLPREREPRHRPRSRRRHVPHGWWGPWRPRPRSLVGARREEALSGSRPSVTTDFRVVFREALVRGLDFKVPRDFFPGYDSKRSLGLFS